MFFLKFGFFVKTRNHGFEIRASLLIVYIEKKWMDLSSLLLNFYFKYQNASSFKTHKNPTQYALSDKGDLLPHVIRPSHNKMLLGDPGGVNSAAQLSLSDLSSGAHPPHSHSMAVAVPDITASIWWVKRKVSSLYHWDNLNKSLARAMGMPWLSEGSIGLRGVSGPNKDGVSQQERKEKWHLGCPPTVSASSATQVLFIFFREEGRLVSLSK